MKKIFTLIVVLISVTALDAQELKVATFNLRMETPSDTGNLWKDRVTPVTNLIRYHDFDVFGTQEGFKNQLEDIRKSLPEYSYYGRGRDDGKDNGEHSAVFFKKEKYILLQSGDFWLSETPGKPGKGWDARCCNRICSWVQLKDRATGKRIYFFNVHFDHEGKIAREESAKLIIREMQRIAQGGNAILTGDFNADRNSVPYKIISGSGYLRDSYGDVKFPYEHNGSFNGFGKTLNSNGVIDHIFITKNGKADKWAILTDTYRGKFPSDHFPVEATVRF